MYSKERINQTKAVAVRLLLLLLAMELVYLVVGNVILMSGKLKDWSQGDNLWLSYDSAHTILPGRVSAQGVLLRVEDYNMQFELAVDDVTVDVSLHELVLKRFHAVRVRTEGTDFKFRHKVEQVGDNALRLAAYPKIEGFDDPPLYRGREPAPISDDEYDLWSVRLDNVVAQVRELWVLEYRFVGSAVASGAFELQPARRLEIDPSRLEIGSGKLHVGPRRVADSVSGVITSSMPSTAVAEMGGTNAFKPLTASARLDLQGGDLEFLDVYLKPIVGISAQGPFEMRLEASLVRGRIASQTRATVTSDKASVSTPVGHVEGDMKLQIRVKESSEDSALVATFRSEKARGRDRNAPSLKEVEVRLKVRPLELYRPLHTEWSSFSVERAEVPSFSWFQRFLRPTDIKLGGSGTLQLNWETAGDAPQGELAGRLDDFSYHQSGFGCRFDAELHSRLARPEGSRVAAENFRLTVDEASITFDDEKTSMWQANLQSSSVRLSNDKSPALQGTVDVQLAPADSLLPLIVADVPEELARYLLDLDQLTGRVAFYVDKKLQRVEILQAESGPLSLEGTWQSQSKGSSGAFLLQNRVINFGIRLKGGNVALEPAASDQFLSDAEPN